MKGKFVCAQCRKMKNKKIIDERCTRRKNKINKTIKDDAKKDENQCENCREMQKSFVVCQSDLNETRLTADT